MILLLVQKEGNDPSLVSQQKTSPVLRFRQTLSLTLYKDFWWRTVLRIFLYLFHQIKWPSLVGWSYLLEKIFLIDLRTFYQCKSWGSKYILDLGNHTWRDAASPQVPLSGCFGIFQLSILIAKYLFGCQLVWGQVRSRAAIVMSPSSLCHPGVSFTTNMKIKNSTETISKHLFTNLIICLWRVRCQIWFCSLNSHADGELERNTTNHNTTTQQNISRFCFFKVTSQVWQGEPGICCCRVLTKFPPQRRENTREIQDKWQIIICGSQRIMKNKINVYRKEVGVHKIWTISDIQFTKVLSLVRNIFFSWSRSREKRWPKQLQV